ncbi:MAG: phosphoribosylglycinamide formyltransferase [Acidobacteria bacterium]|jgi:phosphoribosylglycinamide formyltransferase-1|nr:phosphoribosylglycinamide formyltransferase [Acidobacteriota bacterium]
MIQARRRVGILISGRGSNMVALLEGMRAGEIPAEAAVVVSNDPDAVGLAKARAYGVATAVVPQREFKGKGRQAHDEAVAAELDRHGVELVCLAGYMRILSPWFVERYHGRLLNIHPALLPAFPGLHGAKQALDHGVRVTGCTVHFVDAEVDHGPIVAQAAVAVQPGDTEETLAARILEQEHRIYPLALRLLAQERLSIDGHRVVVAAEEPGLPAAIVSPDPGDPTISP